MKPKLNWNRNVPESYVQLTRKITPSNLNKIKQNHVSDLDSHWSIHRHVASFLKWEEGRLILNKILTSKKKARGWKDIFLNPSPLAKSDADQKTLASKDVQKILFVVERGGGNKYTFSLKISLLIYLFSNRFFTWCHKNREGGNYM